MARSSAAAVAPRAPAKRGSRHATTQTQRRPVRRSSGPAKGRNAAHTRQRAAAAGRTASAAAKPRTAPLVQRLAQGRTGAIADQLLRGRACVAIVFALLVGIVALNVSLLEMNEGIARTNAKATALEHKNAKLRSRLAPLGSSERIQREAVKRGSSLPAAGDGSYVRGSIGRNAKLAAARMTAPGMGEGTASRPAAQVQEETQAVSGTTTTTPPVQPTTPVASTATAQPTPPTPVGP